MVILNHSNVQGNTPLHTLLLSNKPRQSIIKLLLDRGAKLLARNQDDQTCLELISTKLPRAIGQLKLSSFSCVFFFANFHK